MFGKIFRQKDFDVRISRPLQLRYAGQVLVFGGQSAGWYRSEWLAFAKQGFVMKLPVCHGRYEL